MGRQFILFGVLLALLQVLLGAFAAHWLKVGWSADQQRWFDIANSYHGGQALGLMLCGLASQTLGASRLFNRACLALLLGILVFSGSLYLMAFTAVRWLGAITPIGGVLLILGWVLFALAVYKTTKTSVQA